MELVANVWCGISSRRLPEIISVGETREEFELRQAELVNSGALPTRMDVVVPGQDPWWDGHWRGIDLSRAPASQEMSQVFTIWPLREESWSPRFLDSLLTYLIYQGWSKHHLLDLVALFRPVLHVRLVDRFSQTERHTVLTHLQTAWGRRLAVADELELDRSG